MPETPTNGNDSTESIIEAVEKSNLEPSQILAIKQVITTSTFEGPLPPPDILKGYEDILPGASDRILAMAESEEEHRHKFDEKCQSADARDSLLGILAAFFLGTLATVGGIVAIMTEHQIAGTILSGIGLTGILATFLSNTQATWKMNKNDVEKKDAE